MLRRQKATQTTGLLAFGSAAGWDISIDEYLDVDDQWTIEIDSAQLYLRFVVDRLSIIDEAIAFLQRGLQESRQAPVTSGADQVALGKWGPAKVFLVWDSENSARCALLIGPHHECAMRFNLLERDILSLLEGLQQVSDDLNGTR